MGQTGEGKNKEGESKRRKRQGVTKGNKNKRNIENREWKVKNVTEKKNEK